MPNVTNTQLLNAAETGDLSVLKEWKKQNKTQNEGVDVNCEDSNGWTPLHLACLEGQLECVKYLIESCGADINCKDNNGYTPLHHACSNGQPECAKYLIKSCGADVNCKNNTGLTPLHAACYLGRLECVKYLIESCEADINRKANYGDTPLHHACNNGHLECVAYLVASCEADINCKDNDGDTPLHDACSKGHLECVVYLVASTNADTDIQNNNNKTPLDVIDATLQIKMIKRLDHLSHRNSQLQEKNEHLEQQLKWEKEVKRQNEKENEQLEQQLEREKEAKRQNEQENEQLKRQLEQKEQENEQLKQQLKWEKEEKKQKEQENEQLEQQLEQKEQEKTQKEEENEQLKQQLERKEESTQRLLSKSQQENEQLKRKLKQHLKISIDQDRCAAVHAEAIADITFLCGQGDEQQSIKANSAVLMVTVPSIQTLINSGIQHQCTHNGAHDGAQDTTEPIQTTVPLPNFQPKHVRYVLQCIYRGEISFNNNTHDFAGDDDASQPTPTLTGQDDLQQLILVANEFGFWRLKLVLEAELACKHLTEDTMIDVLIFAHQHNCLVLKDAAMRMVAESEKDMFTHPDFGKLILHHQLMTETQVFCSGRMESDGIDDEYSHMSMVELYKVIDEDKGTAQVDSYMDRATLVDFVRSLSIKSSKVIETDGAATEDLNPDSITAMAFLPWLLVLLLALRLPMPQDLLYSGAVGLISSFLMSLSDAPHLRSLFVTARHSSLASSSASSASSSSLAMVAFIDAGWRAILCAAAACLITSLLHFFVA